MYFPKTVQLLLFVWTIYMVFPVSEENYKNINIFDQAARVISG